MRAFWLLIVMVMACPGFAFAQGEAVNAPAAPAEPEEDIFAPAEGGQEAPAASPEQAEQKPLEKLSVQVEEGLLSVQADDAPLGEVMKKIAKEAGFTLEQEDPMLSQTKVSTRFRGVEIERGIQRIFGLVGHKDYFMHYDDEGNITRVEMLKSAASAPGAPSRPGVRRPTVTRPTTTTTPSTRPAAPPMMRRPVPTRERKTTTTRPEGITTIVPEEEVTPPGMEIMPFEEPGVPEEVPGGPGEELIEEAPPVEPAAPEPEAEPSEEPATPAAPYIPPATSPMYTPPKGQP